MTDEAGGFVDDEQVFVFMDDGKEMVQVADGPEFQATQATFSLFLASIDWAAGAVEGVWHAE